MPWFLYNVLFAVGYTLMLPKFFYRMWRRGGYRRGFGERFGRYNPHVIEEIQRVPRIWVHAVSVGEIYVALNFMKTCREKHPEWCFVLTTTTSTGHAIAASNMDPNDALLYFPVDFPVVVRRVMDVIHPLAIVLTECEFWPNLIREADSRAVPVMLINGRMSDSSYRGYKLMRGMFRRITEMMSLFCVQGETDAERLRALDVPGDRIMVVGSSKYDMADISGGHREYVHALLQAAGMKEGALVIVGGSTWSGEEEILLRLFKRIRESHPETFLVLVPRHVERTRQVMAVLKRSGVSWALRSSLKPPQVSEDAPVDVLLVDTTGELKDFYVHADIIFVGKSLTQHGGQNVIEPAALGKPVVVGPNMENFVPVMADLSAANAVVQVADDVELYACLIALLEDASRREELGQRARNVVMDRRGAVQKTVDLFAHHLDKDGARVVGDMSV
ncbi:MAG: hypothetical protein ISS35_03870 [Kiritimatiellae bacterium]|nr:hypothetical protein [Kiritimatiellia bacterium]